MERIIIAHIYNPGSAATNRILAYARGFHNLGLDVILILGMSKLMPPPLLSDGIKIFECKAKHTKLNYFLSRKVKDYYLPGKTAILIYGSPAMCWYLPKTKFNIFYECTEVPFYGRKKTVRSRVKEGIKNILAKRASGMLVISNALADYFRRIGVKNIAVINMFVDAERFNQQTTTNDRKYVAYCGTISLFKDGVDSLIRSFSMFNKLHPEFELKLIGRFESRADEVQLKALVAELQLEQSVCFTGLVKPSEMPKLLCGAQILALARPDNEQARFGFPTKLGEYLATGKPVVLTNVGEISAFLKDGVNCRMTEPGNPEEFANCLSWVADHYEDALKLGEAGRLLTISEFSSVEQSKRALAFMESCIV